MQLQSDQRRHFNDLANFCTQQLQQQLHSGLLRGRRKCNSYIRKLHTIRTLFASILRNQKWKVDSIGQLSIAEKMFKNGWTQVGCIFLQWQLQLATASAVAAGGGRGGGRGLSYYDLTASLTVLLSWLGFKPSCPRLQLGLVGGTGSRDRQNQPVCKKDSTPHPLSLIHFPWIFVSSWKYISNYSSKYPTGCVTSCADS